ncbi:MAG: cyclic nucleotide-binding domain-containing protein [Fibrobacterota bacterium]
MADTGFQYINTMIQLRKCSLFSQLAPSELRRITAVTENYLCYKDEIIVKRGDTAVGLYILVKGAVILTDHAGNAREIRVDSDHHADFFGETELLRPGSRIYHTVTTRENCEVLFISRSKMYAIMIENPTITIKIAESFAARFNRLRG